MTFADGTTKDDLAPTSAPVKKTKRRVVYRSERDKRAALRMAAEVGIVKASKKLGVPVSSISRWKAQGLKPLRKAPARDPRPDLQRLRGSLSAMMPPGEYTIAPKREVVDTPAGPIDVACEGRATAARVLVQLVLDELDPACTSAKLLSAAVKVLAP